MIKLIPYLRFAWAILILFNTVTNANLDSSSPDYSGTFLGLSTTLVALGFALYCIITGIQEIRNRPVRAIFFDIFGIIIEIIFLFIGFYLLYIIEDLFEHPYDFWRITQTILFNIGLVIIIFIDLRRMWTNYISRQHSA